MSTQLADGRPDSPTPLYFVNKIFSIVVNLIFRLLVIIVWAIMLARNDSVPLWEKATFSLS